MYSGVRKGSHRAYSSCPLSYIVQIMKATSAARATRLTTV